MLLPVCNSCGLPLVGQEKAEDRCWCDTHGNWTMREVKENDDRKTD